jgi:hypothetical protein
VQVEAVQLRLARPAGKSRGRQVAGSGLEFQQTHGTNVTVWHFKT